LADAAMGASSTPRCDPARSSAIQHRDILASDIALLCLGKSDFEAFTAFRSDAFFDESSSTASSRPIWTSSACARVSSPPTRWWDCAQLADNLLRSIGQEVLLGAKAPPQHSAKRRRLHTVMQ
jgi:hypothetical protein